MTEAKAKALVDLLVELAHEIALEAIYRHEGDDETAGDTSAVKDKLVALLSGPWEGEE